MSSFQVERRIHPPRRRTDGELRTAQERLSLAVEASGLGTFYCPMPIGRIEWNDKCKEHFWLPPDAEIDFDVFYSIIHPDDRERTRQAVEGAVFGRQNYDIEYRTVSPAGQIRWLRAIGRSFCGPDGEPTRFDGVTLDITAAKQTEHALEVQTEELRRISARLQFLDALAEAKREVASPLDIMRIVTARVGRYLRVSRCAYASVEADEERFTILDDYTDGCPTSAGSYFLSLFGARAAADQRAGRTLIINDVERELASGEGAQMFTSIGIKAIVCCPLLKEGRLVAMMAVHQEVPRRWEIDEVRLLEEVVERSWNTIERVKANQALVAQREQLLAAERAARSEAERAGRIKDEFLATLSHELRTPLSAIVGWAQILGQAPGDVVTVREGIEVIARNARMQTRIIEDLLDMSRIITGNIRLDIRPLELAPIVEAAMKTVQPAADARNIALETDLDPALTLPADPTRLQQVFWNLLSNAIKFTPPGGRVRVTARRFPTHIEVDVRDNGEGIAPGFVPHVFERFRQADASSTRRHGGLGLGLAITRQLVELHGGSVSAASAGVGQGSTFTVTLPLAPLPPARPEGSASSPDPRANASAPAPAPAGSLAGRRILVVDDQPDAREVTKRLLTAQGADVRSAGEARTAFATLQEWRPDLLVCDIGMPEEDGLSLIRRIRRLPPEGGGATPAVALTAYARSEDRADALRAGFQMHLAKPVSGSELLAVAARLAEVSANKL